MRFLLVALILCLPSLPANSADLDLLATCGGSSGYSYYVEGGYVDASKAGFTTDTISKGSIQLLMSEDGKLTDIVQIDASDSRLSALEEGASTFAMVNGTNVTVIVAYEGVIENYTFRFETHEVTWSKSSFGYALDKHSLFQAPCVFQ